MPKPRLVEATVDRRVTTIVLSWKVEGDLHSESTPWLLSVDLIGESDGPAHQFTVRWEDESLRTGYSDWKSGMHYAAPTARIDRRGDTWTAVFDADDEFARAGEWQAVLSFNEPDNSNRSQVDGTF